VEVGEEERGQFSFGANGVRKLLLVSYKTMSFGLKMGKF
jgi:hypothetical protein